ncbi:signal peptide protein [Cupriavidus sp. SK-4]|nr:signal peptide protein [Cupriavidus sp. SK-4]
MRKSVLFLTALLLASAPGLALAHNCPNEMKAIDAKLSTKPALSPENSAKVAKLRADGETYHKAGKHDESMKSLLEAKKILGI